MADRVGDDVGDVLVDQGVGDLSAPPRALHHPGSPQHAQVLADEWLGYAQGVHQLVYAAGAVGQLGHDRHPNRRRQRAQ